MLENKKILLTGATGFVGYHLAKTLSVSSIVYCLVRHTSNLDKLNKIVGLQFIYYDGSFESIVKQTSRIEFDLVYHLASLFIAEHKSENIDDLIDSNVKFPTQLLEALIINNKKLKFVNTATAWQSYTDVPYDPVCLYAATKQSFEDILQYYHKVKNVSCITLRLYDTYGPEDDRKKLLWLLNNLKRTKNCLDMSKGEQTINLVYIDDVVNAFILAGQQLLAATESMNKIYGVYNKEGYSIKRIVEVFEKVNACKLNINWGAREYRLREVMQPYYLYATVPGWNPKYELTTGLEILFKSK